MPHWNQPASFRDGGVHKLNHPPTRTSKHMAATKTRYSSSVPSEPGGASRRPSGRAAKTTNRAAACQTPCTTCPRPMMRLASSRGARRASNGQGKLSGSSSTSRIPTSKRRSTDVPPAAANSVPAIANSDAAATSKSQRSAALPRLKTMAMIVVAAMSDVRHAATRAVMPNTPAATTCATPSFLRPRFHGNGQMKPERTENGASQARSCQL